MGIKENIEQFIEEIQKITGYSIPSKSKPVSTALEEDEKIIIEGRVANIRLWKKILLALGVVQGIITMIKAIILEGFHFWIFLYFIAVFSVHAIFAFLPYMFGWHKISITVTDKRVFGCAVRSRRVDLPVDSITAVGASPLKGIAVTTSSGSIKFKMISNRNDVFNAISKILVRRQNSSSKPSTVVQNVAASGADELKKYKDLLNDGIITQEEFDAKKKQILGL